MSDLISDQMSDQIEIHHVKKSISPSLMVLIFGKSYTSSDCVSGGTADAHGSGPCTRKGVGVQIPSRAREK